MSRHVLNIQIQTEARICSVDDKDNDAGSPRAPSCQQGRPGSWLSPSQCSDSADVGFASSLPLCRSGVLVLRIYFFSVNLTLGESDIMLLLYYAEWYPNIALLKINEDKNSWRC